MDSWRGYFYDKDYVKMVERAQTSHLPDPFDTTSIEQGIGVYYTNRAKKFMDTVKPNQFKLVSGVPKKYNQKIFLLSINF